MRYWAPSRRELVAEVLAVLALPGFNLASSIIEGRSPSLVVLTTLGTLAIVLAVIAIWEWLSQPRRQRVLVGKELLDTVDVWLRENGYGRAPIVLENYDYALLASRDGVGVYVAVEESRNTLTFVGIRQQDGSSTLLEAMRQQALVDLKYELPYELLRFGAAYQVSEQPNYAIGYFAYLAVDETLTEGKVLEKVEFIRRADGLVNLLAQRRAVADLFIQASLPGAFGGSGTSQTPPPESDPGTPIPRPPEE